MTRRIPIAAATAVALVLLVAPMGSAQPGGAPARDARADAAGFGEDVADLARDRPTDDVGTRDSSGREHGQAVSELARGWPEARDGALGRSTTDHGLTVSEFARGGPLGRADAGRARIP